MKTLLKYVWIIAASTGFALPVGAKHKHKDDDEKEHSSKIKIVEVEREDEDNDNRKIKIFPGRKHDPWFNVEIRPAEKQVIREYITVWQEKKPRSLPPGLAKKVARGGELPPGWQKKVIAGEIMPLVVYRIAQPLPDAILIKMPRQPPGTVLMTVDGKLVRLAEATRTIFDVFEFD